MDRMLNRGRVLAIVGALSLLTFVCIMEWSRVEILEGFLKHESHVTKVQQTEILDLQAQLAAEKKARASEQQAVQDVFDHLGLFERNNFDSKDLIEARRRAYATGYIVPMQFCGGPIQR